MNNNDHIATSNNVADTHTTTPRPEGATTRLPKSRTIMRAGVHAVGLATLDMICNKLPTCNIVIQPKHTTRKFSWASTAMRATDNDPFPATETLFVLSSDNFKETLESNPGSFGILALLPQEPMPPAKDLDAFANRLTVLYPKDPATKSTPLELLSYLQSMFFTLYRWHAAMQSIIDSRGKMQALLDIANEQLPGFLDITGPTFNLLAYTKNIEAPGTLTKKLVETGTHSKEWIERIEKQGVVRDWAHQDETIAFDPIPSIPFPFISKIMRHDSVYLGHVVMICTEGQPNQGTIDTFDIFADYAADLMARTSTLSGDSRAGQVNRAAAFLATLLDGDELGKRQVDAQAELLNMEDDVEFRVVVLDPLSGVFAANTAHLAEELSTRIPSDYFFAFAYNGQVFGLFHGETWTSDYDVRDMNAVRTFCVRYGCNGFVSDRFHNLGEVSLAYKQALYARKYRTAIDSELAPVIDASTADPQNNISSEDETTSPTCLPEGTPGRLYFFEDAFCFYLFEFCTPSATSNADDSNNTNAMSVFNDDQGILGNVGQDDTFRDFCMNGTVLDDIADASDPEDTNDIKILYYFLFFERKATPAANALHMHRNNVLYRISSIERKYAIDLSRSETRLRLQTCFLYKIATSQNFRALICD
jgi:hypothetical protein